MSATQDEVDNDSDAYAEGSVLTKFLGDGPKVKIMAAFLAEPNAEYDKTITEIADLAGVSRNTVYRHLDDLLDVGAVEKTRESGGSPRYRLNRDNDAAKRLAQLEWDLLEILHDDEDDAA